MISKLIFGGSKSQLVCVFCFVAEADVKKKWKNLKDKYRKELKQTREHRSGDPGGSSKESDWVFFKLLDFLKDQMIPGKMSGNLPSCQEKGSHLGDLQLLLTDDEEREVVDSLLGDETSSEISVQPFVPEANRLNKQALSDTSCSGGSTPMINPNSEHSRRKQRRRQDPHTDKIIELEERKLKYMLEDRETEKDEDYHFFMSLVPHMKNFSAQQKLRVRNKIQNVIIEEMDRAEWTSRNQHVGGISGFNYGPSFNPPDANLSNN